MSNPHPSHEKKTANARRHGAGRRTAHGAGRGRDADGETPALIEGLAARQAAAAMLSAVVDHRQNLEALPGAPGNPLARFALDARDHALANAVVRSALRHRGALSAMVAAMLERPLPERAKSVHHILHVALAQMLFLRVPESAAVNIAVEAARADAQARRFAPLVNALLRRAGREGEAAFLDAQAVAVDVPDWLFDALSIDHGAEQARDMLAVNRTEAAIDLTVKDDPEGWAEKLGGIMLPTGTVRVAGIEAPIPEWPGYDDGAWWVQDAAAALPARMLGDVRGMDVADICAAPGGKTAQLALAGANVTAFDISKARLARLQENMARLGFGVAIEAGDARRHRPARPYGAVLLDAPCSSTGTLRRHPDVAWAKTPEDVANLVRVQNQLLDAAFAMLKPGGLLVVANCSLLKAEGETLVSQWLERTPDAEPVPVTAERDGAALAALADARGFMRTTPLAMPHENPRLAGMDGFFAARVTRRG
jgi:16S rRNA (cytosine967-C5)-methyltransferase